MSQELSSSYGWRENGEAGSIWDKEKMNMRTTTTTTTETKYRNQQNS